MAGSASPKVADACADSVAGNTRRRSAPCLVPDALLRGALAKAEPKTLRYRILHVGALLVRRGRRLILQIDESWPWAPNLERGFARIRTAFG